MTAGRVHLFGHFVLKRSWPDSAAVRCEQLQAPGFDSALRVAKNRETLKCLSRTPADRRKGFVLGEKRTKRSPV